jgi:peptide/bleomycin uptake transporter
MFRPFFLTKEYRLWAWGVLALLIAMTVGQVYLSVLINDWYGNFYNAVQTLNAKAFWHAFIPFSYLAAGAVLLPTFATYIAQHYTFKWREALTFAYLPLWEASDDRVEGSSQRIQEDIMRFAQMTYRLGLGFLRAIMTLIAFVPILWHLGEKLYIFNHFSVPGMLVWMAVISSLGGMLVSVWVGRKLPRLEYNNQKTEAAFRKSLVYGEDQRLAVDKDLLKAQFYDLKTNYLALFNQFKYFNLWGNTYFQIAIVIPYLMGGQAFLAGVILLGGLRQIANAFEMVHNSFSYFINNWTDMMDLQSVILRLREFQKAINYK